jgi:L-cysteine desulfidase
MYDIFMNLLRQEVVPAMGCTEPAAVALAAAYAADVLPGEVQRATILVSPSILKNGMGVGIPGTGLIGLEIAAALGLVVSNPQKQLQVLADLNDMHIAKAKEMVQRGLIEIALQASDDKIYIEVVIEDGTNRARAVIRWRHSWLHRLELNDQVLMYQEGGESSDNHLISVDSFSIRDYYDFATNVTYEQLLTIDLGEIINRRIADFGLDQSSGMAVGKMIMQQIEDGLLGNDLHHFAMALTAAATDARMSGCTLPVISNTGSGNQGLSITLPIIAAAEKLKSNHESLVRALALGHLVSVHIKNR